MLHFHMLPEVILLRGAVEVTPRISALELVSRRLMTGSVSVKVCLQPERSLAQRARVWPIMIFAVPTGGSLISVDLETSCPSGTKGTNLLVHVLFRKTFGATLALKNESGRL